MIRQYLILLRTFWLGGLWTAAYLVRPLLEHRGFFPQHGLEVMHAVVGIGAVCGILIFLLARMSGPLLWSESPLQLLLVMLLLSFCYFGLLPWWKLQMIVVHAMSVLGVIWLWKAPALVVRKDRYRT
jgi:predicted MFS family arabinose efflux permease